MIPLSPSSSADLVTTIEGRVLVYLDSLAFIEPRKCLAVFVSDDSLFHVSSFVSHCETVWLLPTPYGVSSRAGDSSGLDPRHGSYKISLPKPSNRSPVSSPHWDGGASS